MLIDDERLETALKRLAKSDALVAELHMKAERAEFKAKATKDAIFLRSEGSVAERNALAGTSEDYALAMESYFTALQAHDTLKNERSREVLVIDVWRSLNSAKGKGLIT
jgi:hypothetical protein